MTYLLDTHTFLWLLQSPDSVPDQIRKLAADSSETLLLSIVTPWEIAVKVGIGKLEAPEVLADFEGIAKAGHYGLLETTVHQVIRAGLLPLHHRDPFDRLLAAQALEIGIPLISRDAIFDTYGVRRIWNDGAHKDTKTGNRTGQTDPR